MFLMLLFVKSIHIFDEDTAVDFLGPIPPQSWRLERLRFIFTGHSLNAVSRKSQDRRSCSSIFIHSSGLLARSLLAEVDI